MKHTRPRFERALYGGAFNPPTFGHVAVVERLLREGFETVLVMPCCGHAFGKHLAPAADRLALTRACFAKHAQVEVSGLEIELGLNGSTFELLGHLARHPDYAARQIHVVIGSDEANVFHRWKRYEELREQFRFVVVTRPGHPLGAEAAWAAQPRHLILADDGSLPAAASTGARAALAAGDHAAIQGLVPRPVLDEIRARGLYAERALAPVPAL